MMKWLVLCAVFIALFFGPSPEQPSRHQSTQLDPAFFDQAYRQAPMILPARAGAIGGTVPHHLLAAPLIAAFFESLQPLEPRRVIVIGPDHLRRSRRPAVTTTGSWKTPYGTLSADTDAMSRLINAGLLTEDQALFDVEHSISAITPFIRRSLPSAKIVPVLVNHRLSDEAARTLAAALPLDEHTVIIASVDFSHYLPYAVARFHDRKSRATLSSGEVNDLKNLEVDSSESLAVFSYAARRIGAMSAELVAASTGAELSGRPDTLEGTSYVLLRFSRGLRINDATHTTLVYPYESRVHTAEDRFFRGYDDEVGQDKTSSTRLRGRQLLIDTLPGGAPHLSITSSTIALHLPPVYPGLAAGVVTDASSITMYLFPIGGLPGFPKLLMDERARGVLTSLHPEALDGILHLPL